jgi:hypothetical protein
VFRTSRRRLGNAGVPVLHLDRRHARLVSRRVSSPSARYLIPRPAPTVCACRPPNRHGLAACSARAPPSYQISRASAMNVWLLGQ